MSFAASNSAPALMQNPAREVVRLQDDGLPFIVETYVVGGPTAEHTAFVFTPRYPMVVGPERLAHLRSSPAGLSDVERRLVDLVRRHDTPVDVILFRAADDDGRRLWEFDTVFDDDALVDAGVTMAKSLLPFHRRLLEARVALMVHTDWGIRECFAMRRATEVLIEELESSEHRDRRTQMDLWILKNMLLHAALSHDHVVDSLLPRHLKLISGRRERIEGLLASPLSPA